MCSLVFLSQICVEVGAKTFDLKFESVCQSLFSADNVKVWKVLVLYGPSGDGEAERQEERHVPLEEELPASNRGGRKTRNVHHFLSDVSVFALK